MVYGREYDGKVYHFEPSGGLINATLIMQDKETDSYWSLMKGRAIAGKAQGTKLKELPLGKKARWQDWLAEHPETLVLSVKGREDGRDGYKGYFLSPDGFRGLFAKDKRMRTKESVFAFHFGNRAYAVAHKKLKKGAAFDLGEFKIFLFRAPKSKMFASTIAFVATEGGFQKNAEGWKTSSGEAFNPETGKFEGGSANRPQPLSGFDTFWYNWSLNNPKTEILK